MRFLLVVLLLLCTGVAWAEDEEAPGPWVLLPYTAFEAEPLAPDAGRGADALIEELRTIEEPRIGLDCTRGGGLTFSEPTDAWGRLVHMGPAALSAVLAHLDDARPTRLKLPPFDEFPMGDVRRRNGFPVPPTQEDERRIATAAFGEGIVTDFGEVSGEDAASGPYEGHTVTVGDCCYAILGQIVCRPYAAIEGQPTLIRVVCSPTDDPRLAKALRAVWGRGDPRQLLARSLARDLHSVGDPYGRLQVAAARRLAAWFPKHADTLIANRISQLQGVWQKDGWDTESLLRGFLDHGGPAARTAWLGLLDPSKPSALLIPALDVLPERPEPDALARVRRVFEATGDIEVLLRCARRLPADASGVFERLELELVRTGQAGVRGHADWVRVMVAMLRADGAASRAILRREMPRRHARKVDGLAAIYLAGDEAAALALAAPLLDDEGPLGGVPLDLEWEVRHRRVCDLAAAVLARSVKDARFDNDDDAAKRDVQIAALRELLSKR